ncbi:MAG TPA: rhodanese-like domain-containing protein, partial [Mycobacterium sp.]|nr:rhodanese-like domain-containing protein [Mycobacterium sp.]
SDNPAATLVDVRTAAEWRFVGVPDLAVLHREVVYLEWVDVTGRPNENFTRDLVDRVATGPVVLLCRSGNRSIPAAAAATAAGLTPAYNVLDGFEGNLDERGHRGASGWRAVGLPWKQS